jgi:hypothetical protein
MNDQDVNVVPDVTSVAHPAPVLRMHETDRMNLELAKANRKLALAEAQTALAKNENAELAYKYVVLQIYLKYGLNENDAINENGEIIKNGALAAATKVE